MSNFNPYMQMPPYGASLPQYPQRTLWPQTAAQGAPRQLVRVSGMDGARAYQMAPNEVVALFDRGIDELKGLVIANGKHAVRE